MLVLRFKVTCQSGAEALVLWSDDGREQCGT